MTSLPSYVCNTHDILAKLHDLEIPPEALLVGIDVESLYTLIPHDWGLRTVSFFLETAHPDFGAQNEIILELLELALTNNYFQFLDGYYQQTRGTAMGAPWAPSYACLHLGLWKWGVVYKMPMYLSRALTWLRYIDDIMMVWLGDREELDEFLSILNKNDRNTVLTHVIDANTISFLDLQITCVDTRLETCTYRKPTAANTLLQASSHHPDHLIKGIPVGQFLWLRRNCSKDDDFHKEATEMFARFKDRGYPQKTLKQAHKKAWLTDRRDPLADKTVSTNGNKKLTSTQAPLRIITNCPYLTY